MKYKIWWHFIQILSFRNDLIDTIKPFFFQLDNNSNHEKYNLKEEKNFIQSLSSDQFYFLAEYHVFDVLEYAPDYERIDKEELNKRKKVEEILKGDKLEEMQRIINEKGLTAISPIIDKFKGVSMKIPIIIECIIQKAVKCFKYLLINGIEDPTIIMEEYISDPRFYQSQHRFEWNCMAMAIYCGENEIIKILEENGIEKEKKLEYIDAAILTYRNTIVKEIINQSEEKINDDALMIGLISSAKNNNIKGTELLINNGANLNRKGIIFQNI